LLESMSMHMLEYECVVEIQSELVLSSPTFKLSYKCMYQSCKFWIIQW